MPGVLKQVDPTFFLAPELDLKTPSSSMMSRARGVKVDLLTTAKTPSDKDRRQAEALILALADRQPGALARAIDAARAHHDRGLARDASAAAKKLSPEARRHLTAL